MESESSTEKRWQKSGVNLYRYVPTGTYYARVRIQGKLKEHSLNTDKITVARLRLNDFVKEERQRAASLTNAGRGKMAGGDAVAIFRAQLDANRQLKPRSKVYRLERLGALLGTWPNFEKQDVSRISKHDCEEWQRRFGAKASPTAFNNTVGTLRMVLDIAVECGARYDNPAKSIKKHRVRAKLPELPSGAKFIELVNAIESFRLGRAKRSANLVRFLAFGGFRKSEAERVTWADCDFNKKIIHVNGDPETGTKNGEVRQVPMIPEMKILLNRLQEENPNAKSNEPVMQVSECQGALNRGCKSVNIPRITHHGLRHLFATRCIEDGVDLPTIAKWLGHKDGGALAMKVYGHLRQEHSVAMAQRVHFGVFEGTQSRELVKEVVNVLGGNEQSPKNFAPSEVSTEDLASN
jgi:integrase